jgi:hypothetical protein
MYQERVTDPQIDRLLGAMGAVVIEGPKACGKTESARRFARSEVRLDVDSNARRAIAVEPSLVLAGETPRLIDEWQVAPELWNHIRRSIDDRRATGQFILTGSAVPADDATRHTGAGRFARLRMRPMALFESGHSSGQVSLAGLLAGDTSRAAETGIDAIALAERIVVGGWPGLIDRSVEDSAIAVRAYLDDIRRADVQRVDGVAHDPDRVLRLMRSLARNVATTVGVSTLARDVGGSDGAVDRETASRYYETLERLMVVEDQPAWGPHLRSRSRIRTSAKRHFVDPSLAAAALRVTPERLLGDLELMGFLFESLVVRDLRVYAQARDAQVLHYRDNTDLEVDAIVEAADGVWGAFEIKLGVGMVDAAAEALLRFAARVDTAKSGSPAVLGVITGMGFGYRRPDGVLVIPIAALGP